MAASEERLQAERPPAIDLYRIALEEYRFQVSLNWQRTQHWFTVNAAIAGAAIALLGPADNRGTYLLVASTFGVGVGASLVAIIASLGQHDYYRAARDHKRKLESDLALGGYAIETTPGMRGEQRRGWHRLKRVTSLYVGLLGFLGLLDASGVGYSLCAAL